MLHPDTIFSLRLLARYNESIGDLANAEDAYRKNVELYTAMVGPRHPDTIGAWVDVGKVCSDRDKFAEAKPILVDALRQQRELFGDEHLATAQTMKLLGALYCKQGSFSQA